LPAGNTKTKSLARGAFSFVNRFALFKATSIESKKSSDCCWSLERIYSAMFI
jgi:hypothetical protein